MLDFLKKREVIQHTRHQESYGAHHSVHYTTLVIHSSPAKKICTPFCSGMCFNGYMDSYCVNTASKTTSIAKIHSFAEIQMVS